MHPQNWKTAQEMASHDGVQYQKTVKKEVSCGVYEAEVRIFYPRLVGGHEVIDNDFLRNVYNRGLPFTQNPNNLFGATALDGIAAGHIDAKLEQIGEQTVADNAEGAQAHGGDGGAGDPTRRPTDFTPKTNATPEQRQQMKAEAERLIDRFTSAGIAYIGGPDLKSNTVRAWKSRGRVGAHWANELCKQKDIKAAGFTRESLRPDVKYWYVD